MTTQTTTVGSKHFVSKVKIKDVNGGAKAFKKLERTRLEHAHRAMANSILNTAMLKAPKLTGALKSDGRVEMRDTAMAVVFGDNRVPYARRRHYENRKNPQTLHYLKDSGDKIVKEGLQKYL